MLANAATSSYAQTNIQLYNQLQETGYAGEDLACVRSAYELALRLFAGRVLSSGRVFLAHVIGAASILASVKASGRVVAAALLHNAYKNGDFGDGEPGVTHERRRYISDAVGTELEAYVHRYYSMSWETKVVRALPEQLPQLSTMDREVVTIFLADNLEKFVDMNLLYGSNSQRVLAFFERTGPAQIAIAQGLGLPELAAEFETQWKAAQTRTLPPELRAASEQKNSSILAPASYRPRLGLRWHHLWRKWRSQD